ncbi:MAG: hypothetical protein ACK5OX_10495 [Desertimonas sp.]
MAATVGLLGACGGDSASIDAVDTTNPTTTAATPTTTEPPDPPDDTVSDETVSDETEPVDTTPVETTIADPDLPDWASGELAIVETDTGPREMPVELVPFCEASRSFCLAAKGLDFIDDGQLGTAQQLFAALGALVPVTIETAPSDEFAREPTAARDQLAVLIPAFEEIGYDDRRLEELSDPEALVDAWTGFAATRDSLNEFLLQACGADEGILIGEAREVTSIAASAAGEAIEPDDPAEEAVAGVPITNASGTIAVSVPTDWDEVDDGSQEGRDALAASSDLPGFGELATPGVLVVRGEGGFRDGGYTGRALEAQATLEAAGCVMLENRD